MRKRRRICYNHLGVSTQKSSASCNKSNFTEKPFGFMPSNDIRYEENDKDGLRRHMCGWYLLYDERLSAPKMRNLTSSH